MEIKKIRANNKTFYDVLIGADRYGYPIRFGRFETYEQAVNALKKLRNTHDIALAA